ncbi:MAG: zinc-ribbon and DUF3426 domain-containing protein [Betaproteobacteria bacterium]|nr:zinc-ribbon and DUF3426 domain-containing protein [Betaproteobacteria bacterium]
MFRLFLSTVPTPTIHFTRCPQCRTTFRITSQQLALREGRARCGNCRTVFNAFAALVNFKGERLPGPGMTPMQHETMTLRDSVSAPEGLFTAIPADTGKSVRPLLPETQTNDHSSISLRVITRESGREAARPVPPREIPMPLPVAASATIAEDAEEPSLPRKKSRKSKPSPMALVLEPSEKPSVWQRLHLPSWCRPLFYLVSLPCLTVLLLAQATFSLHDELASTVPALKPALSAGCRWLHCEIHPPQNLDALSIPSSELQYDPQDAQQLLLSVTLHNNSDRPVAYPRLSLVLTDAHNQMSARLLFAPENYLQPSVDAAAGFPASSDLALRLLLRSSLPRNGYTVALVY